MKFFMAEFTSCSLPSPCTASMGSPIGLIRNASIRKLMRRNVELLCENLPVASGLIEHIDEIAVL